MNTDKLCYIVLFIIIAFLVIYTVMKYNKKEPESAITWMGDPNYKYEPLYTPYTESLNTIPPYNGAAVGDLVL